MNIELRFNGETLAVGPMPHVPRRGEIVEFVVVNDGSFMKGKVEQVTSRHFTTASDEPRVVIDLEHIFPIF